MVNEQIGISTVVSALSITDHLVPCLQSGDKGVSYDGHVDVYKKQLVLTTGRETWMGKSLYR